MQQGPTPNAALADAIERSGFRKDFIASQVGIVPATLSRYLSGQQAPEKVIREKLALLLRRSPDEFISSQGAGIHAAHDGPVDQASGGSSTPRTDSAADARPEKAA